MQAFQAIYEQYYPDVYRFALFLTGDHGRAEDLTADTFVRAWIARDRIKVATVRAYLLTIAKNLHRDECRRARPIDAMPDAVKDPRPGVDLQFQYAADVSQVRNRLGQVAKGDRQAFLMFIVRGMSHREIAAALGVTIGAVKSRIFRAREAIVAATRPHTKGELS